VIQVVEEEAVPVVVAVEEEEEVEEVEEVEVVEEVEEILHLPRPQHPPRVLGLHAGDDDEVVS